MAQNTLPARIRQNKGKGAARKLRKNNRIPATFYGPDASPLMLAVDYPELERILKKSSGEHMILGLKIESDNGTETKQVMLKELQIDPIKDTYIHADFYEISMDREITVDIPIHLINTPIGVPLGGVLQQIRREVTITCLPDKLIEHVDVDVSELDIGGSVHIEDILLSDDLKIAQDAQLTVAVVAAPTVEVEEEEIEEAEEGVDEETTEAEGEETESGPQSEEGK